MRNSLLFCIILGCSEIFCVVLGCSEKPSNPQPSGHECLFKSGNLVQLNSGGSIMSVCCCDLGNDQISDKVSVTWHDTLGQPHNESYFAVHLRKIDSTEFDAGVK